VPSPFNITTPTGNVVLNNRRGTVTFTVALAARRKTRASARIIMSPDAATPAWLTLVLPEGGSTPDDPIREFNLNDSKQYQVKIAPPDTLGPASFTFRLVVADEVDPEENFSESTEVSFTVPEPVKQSSTPVGLIIAIVLGVLLVIGIIAGVVITSNQRNVGATATSVASNLTAQANQTATEAEALTRTAQARQTATAAVQQTVSVETATANAQATQTAVAQQTAGAQTAIANVQATQTAAAARAEFVITGASSAVCSIIQNFPLPIHDVGAVFQVFNSGTIPLQSVFFEIQVPQGTVVNQISLNAPFGNLFDPCVPSRGRSLSPGESGSLQIKQRVTGFLSNGTLLIKLCSQPNLQGLCQEQTQDFSF
jgi:hypothetical protein